MSDLISNLQRLGDAEHDDLSVAHDALAEIVRLRILTVEQHDEIERLRDLLRVEQALALRQDPFRCYDIECEWFGRPVRAGDCQCHHLQATTHRANVRDALAKKEQR